MRIYQRRRLSICVSLIAFLAAATPAAMAQAWDSYAAKFVCGSETAPGASMVLGRYKTIVNIHNPHYLLDQAGAPISVAFFKKVVLARPQGDPLLPPSCKQFDELRADHAVFMDCITIKNLLALSGLPSAGDIEGFAVIEVPPQGIAGVAPPLDVVAVYSARPRPAAGEVTSMDVERILPTKILGVPTEDPCVPD